MNKCFHGNNNTLSKDYPEEKEKEREREKRKKKRIILYVSEIKVSDPYIRTGKIY